MKLHVDRFAPNVRRLLMFLAEKGIELAIEEHRIEDGDSRSPALLRLNPLGQLPILELDDGRGLSESVAICRYLEALHPYPSLFAASAQERAFVEMWLRRAELELFIPAVDYGHHSHPAFQGHFGQIPAWADRCRQRVTASYDLLDLELGSRPHVACDSFTVADITAYCGVEVATLWDVTVPDRCAALAAWHRRTGARASAAVARYAT